MPKTTSDALQRRLAGITEPNAILRIIADHIMRNYHRVSAREIAALLLITAERGVKP